MYHLKISLVTELNFSNSVISHSWFLGYIFFLVVCMIYYPLCSQTSATFPQCLGLQIISCRSP